MQTGYNCLPYQSTQPTTQMTDIELTQARATAAAELARVEAAIAERNKAQRQERIAQVRALMAEHSITMQDIGAKPVAVKAAKPARPAKYRNDAGQTWTGLGKRPDWLRMAIANGMALDVFRIAA